MIRKELTIHYECDRCGTKQERTPHEYINLSEQQDIIKAHLDKSREDGWVRWRSREYCPSCSTNLG